jgi:hypothetical protein
MVKAFMRQFPLAETCIAMKPILAVFWNICLLRRGPELVPTHPWFVGAVVSADVLSNFFIAMQFGSDTSAVQIATRILVSMAAVAVATWMMLSMRDVAGRYPATITALFGCDLLFTLLSAILIPLAGDSEAFRAGIVNLIVIWSIAVNGFILHRAMNVTVFIGILLALGTAFLAGLLSFAASGPP